MKKAVKWIAAVFIIMVLALIGYVIYVFAAYDRLPDRMTLEVYKSDNTNGDNGARGMTSGSDADPAAATKNEEPDEGKLYSIMSYNIGFGAYQIGRAHV